MTEPTAALSGAVVGETSHEAQGFEVFFRAEQRRLYGTLCLVTGNRAEAEELMQEAFLRLWERWDSVRGMTDPAGYLYRTAFNLFRNRLRRAIRATRRILSPEPQPDAFSAIDERQDLLSALRAIAPRQRAALVLVDLMDTTSEEAGRLLGVRASTARALASQARHAMRERMKPEEERHE
jgi:RNA polymerase sigma-70 factor (ECF subfamily)